MDHDNIYLPSRSAQVRRPRRALVVLAVLVLILLFSARTAVSWFVENLWYGSLGFREIFWKTLEMQWGVFATFTVLTFAILFGWTMILSRTAGAELRSAGTFVIGGRVISLPFDSVLRIGGLLLSVIAALLSGASMESDWQRIALFLHAPHTAVAAEPIFGRSVDFYLFTLPALQMISGWMVAIALLLCVSGVFLLLVAGGSRLSTSGFDRTRPLPWRTLSIAEALLLAVFAWRTYLSRFDLLFDDHSVFTGVGYTEAHVLLTGLLVVSIALVAGALIALINLVSRPRMSWVILAAAPAVVCFLVVQISAWYVSSFIVKPNQLVREQPYIEHNIDATRRAFALDRITRQEFPADVEVEAADPTHNQATLGNIRLWDWQALQRTLQQIQEIRTYYDFPDVDIDRYPIDGQTRQVMLAARELSVEKLPESSRNWINEKLIYTHGYGITMNPVNGFTPEGLPKLLISNMPVQSSVPALQVKRPEIYFGQLTETDVYVKTRQKEFNFPQGETNSLTSYEGQGGIAMGGLLQRALLSFDRGDLSKVPFSDDIGPESRLLMRRNIFKRVQELAPFLTYEGDAYVVLQDDGRLMWMLDAYTSADHYPNATRYEMRGDSINYLRNSVKVTVDAYTGATTFYVFDNQDPVIAAWRGIFPSLFKDGSAMPPDLRRHVRYPELLLAVQARVYALYHMTNPGAFYNREDLWNVASEVRTTDEGRQGPGAMDPNFVLMKLPGEQGVEFVDILPFTPSNRNNLIGWIAGRADGDNYGKAVVYDFPKTRLVDGPMQIEARIDQNAQLSGQLTLWNQQGSHVRRGTLLVIPCGKALIYAEAIYLQAERSPMPELRLVVLALQDKLAYGSSFEAALQSLFAGTPSSLTEAPRSEDDTKTAATPAVSRPGVQPDVNGMIHDAARAFGDYQRLTAEGKLSEAGQKLQELKQKLDQLNTRSK